MNNRRQGPRGGAGNTAPFVVLRWAALLAVLAWVLPICTHSSAETPPLPAASVSADRTIAGPPVLTGAVLTGAVPTVEADRTCPNSQHGPGDAHGRSTTGAAVNTASPLPAPCPRAVDASAVGPLGASPARGAPPDLAHTPGIHQLQVQRI